MDKKKIQEFLEHKISEVEKGENQKDALEQEEGEEESVQAVVDLIERDFMDLEDQGAFAELIQGLAFAENDFATAFIAELQDGEDMKDKALSASAEADLEEELASQIEDSEPGGVS